MSGYLQRAAYEEDDALAQGAVLLVI
ncbi:RND transporter, partial [Burkholderia thailandensis]